MLDTAYGHWRDVVVPRAQLIVALDYPRYVSLARLLRRTARRVVTRELVCDQNQESIRQAVSRDSIILWHTRSFTTKRQQLDWESGPTAPPVVRLRSPRAAEAWLRTLA